VVIEFTLENVACRAGTTCNALKASPASKDLGRLQVGKPHRQILEVTNVGPEPLRVDTVRMEAVPGYPDARADFTADVLLRPRPVPIALELTPRGTLRQGADFATHPLIRVTAGAGGQTAFQRALDADGAHVVVSGFSLTAVGDAVFEGQRLVYDDPAADFSWTPTEPGVRRPFAEVAFLRWRPPFYVDPGRSFWLRLTAQPRAFGNRRAYLSVGATAASNPGAGVWSRALIKAQGISGPSLVALPSVLSFPRHRLDAAGQVMEHWQLNAIVANYGNSAMNRGTVGIVGPDAARFHLASTHPATAVIAPGDDETFIVASAASCVPPRSPHPVFGPWQYEAQLRVATDGGEAVFELRAQYCPFPP
jgi:hypothetical protein